MANISDNICRRYQDQDRFLHTPGRPKVSNVVARQEIQLLKILSDEGNNSVEILSSKASLLLPSAMFGFEGSSFCDSKKAISIG